MEVQKAVRIFEAALTEEPEDFLAPLTIDPKSLTLTDAKGAFDIVWLGQRRRIDFEIRADVGPKELRNELVHANSTGQKGDLRVVVVRYLTSSVIEVLSRYAVGVGAVDLNGNYMLVGDDFVAVRQDRQNKYPNSRAIKNIYAGDTSMVARLMLLNENTYSSVSEVQEALNRHGGTLALSTVSKALKALDTDVMIEKSRDAISILQAERLLKTLEERYQRPREGEKLRLKINPDELDDLLNRTLGAGNWVRAPEDSSARYTATNPPLENNIYVKADRWQQIEELESLVDERFYNTTLIATPDKWVFFDQKDGWASALESYLALRNRGGKRELETASELLRRLPSQIGG